MGVVILNHSELKLRLEAVDISCGMFSNNSALPPILEPGAAYTLVTEKVRVKTTLWTLGECLRQLNT